MPNKTKKVILLSAALIGFTSLVYEMYSLKVVFLYFAENTHAAAITLSAFLLGLALSSLVFAHFVKSKESRSIQVLVGMQIFIVLYAIGVLQHHEIIPLFIDSISNWNENAYVLNILKFLFVGIYLFIPAFCLGGAFPILNGLYQKNFTSRTQDTGFVYFVDTMGAVLGALISGFILIPFMGLANSLLIPVLANMLVIFFFLKKNIWRVALILIAGVFLFFSYYNYSQNSLISKDQPHINAPNVSIKSGSIYAPELGGHKIDKRRFGNVIFSKSSPFGAVTVGDNAWGMEGNRGLFINYRDMCNTLLTTAEFDIGETTVKNIPSLGNGDILNIGLGCGFTAHAVEKDPFVKTLTVVEVNPMVIEAAEKFFAEFNGDVTHSPKVTLLNQDGTHFIRQTDQIFDAIIIDVEEPGIIQSSPLFTQEYIQIMKEKLQEDGIFALWSVRSDQPEFTKILYNTLKSVFSYVKVQGVKGVLQLYASEHPLDNIEDQIMEAIHKNTTTEAINTLETRELEKYVDISKLFHFPLEHTDRFIRK